MGAIDRRSLLKGAGAAAGAGLLSGPFQGFFQAAAGAKPSQGSPGYGPLQPVADARDGQTRLLLPRGFSYRSFDATGGALSDGSPIPGRHDGMAAFRSGRAGMSILVRNHEVAGPVGAFGDHSDAYDAAAGGGTTTVLVDRYGRVSRSSVSLNGTMMNCSGGAMPWGTWLSCEETVNGPDVGPDFTGVSNASLKQKHGYVFEVPVGGRSSGSPIRSAGRFAHESAAYDARTNAVYLTEDNFGFPSGFYRYLPPTRPLRTKRLDDGGRLQMLAVKGRRNADLAGNAGSAPAVGSELPVEWVDIEDPDPDVNGFTNDAALVAVSSQGLSKGAATFSRLEGAVARGNTIYFTSTQGGAKPADSPAPPGYGDGRGQIWAYHSPTSTLHLLYESPSRAVLDFPDNVTTGRTGTLVLCEDGDQGNFLRGLTRDGYIFDFAKNNIAGRTDDEFAGATFSPDFKTLFVNIQASRGLTFAIWGDWSRGGF